MSDLQTNPYAPPAAVVGDASHTSDGTYIPGGRTVPAGNGASWIGSAWGLFKQSPWAWVGMFLVMMVITFVIAVIPLLNLANLVLMPMFLGGIMIACERQRETGALNIGDLFAGFQTHGGALCIVGLLQFALNMVIWIPVGIIVFITVGASVFTGGGWAGMLSPAGLTTLGVGFLLVMLLILVGAFLIISAVWFAPALVVHQGLSPVDAMKASFNGCMRNIGSGTIYMLLALALSVLMLATLGLGFLVLGPVMQASMYTSYRDIFIKE